MVDDPWPDFVGPDAKALTIYANAIQSGDLLVWTVTYNASDTPGVYTVRPHSTKSKGPLAYSLSSPDLMRLRAMLPPGLYRMDRDPDDFSVIVETWI